MTRPSPFPVIRLPMLEDVRLPPLVRVGLTHRRGPAVGDIAARVGKEVAKSQRLGALPAGASVAVAVGSRGIAHIATVVAAAVAALNERGLSPFIVPAMGSHGGATAAGQTAVLASLGITEDTVGAPIRATMEMITYGATDEGIPCHFDRYAAEADAILVINRVKSHTSFDRPIESGLVKMVAVGLGKAEGARNVHRLGLKGLGEVLPKLAAISLQHAPIAYGLALVEDSAKDLVTVEGVEPEDFFTADERLLILAKSYLARLPFAQIDALVVETLGKEISGAGMDYAVIGRTDLRGVPNPERPFVHKLGILDCTDATKGNALGIGVADYMSHRITTKWDLYAMYMNSVTATFIEKARVPIVLADDRAVLNACVATSWTVDPAAARLCIIRSTLHLNEILVSPALLSDLDGNADARVLSTEEPARFDKDGTLLTRC